MADLFQSSTRIQTTIWALKLVLLSLGIISTLIFFKIAIIPYVFSVLSSLPCLWVSFRSLLSRPYILIILNFIILTIIGVSSSAFHSQTHFPKTVSYKKPVHNYNNSLPDIIFKESMEEYSGEKFMEDAPSLETCSDDSCVTDSEENHRKEKVIKEEEEQKKSQRGWSDFDKTSVGATADYNSEEKTLEETWTMIMEGQGKKKEKQLKKSETWERTRKAADEDSVSLNIMRKMSINREELQERAEAFIKLFRNQMRLQKQESDQRFVDMVSPGV
ncbi:hypothetical protein SLE2022_347370 [Rubroshorea leprosula]